MAISSRRLLRSSEPLVAGVAGGRRGGGGLVLEPVQGVLDALEALGDRAQPRVSRSMSAADGQVQGAHGGLLRQDGLLAGLERPADGAADHGVGHELLGQPPQRLLALPGEPVYEALVTVVAHRGEAIGTARVGSGPSPPDAIPKPLVEP